MIPEELQILLDKEDDENIRMYVDTSDFSKIEPIVELTIIVDTFEGEVKQQWTVVIKGHRVSNIFSETAYEMKILDKHPLLLAYKDQQSTLYFNGKCLDPNSLFIDLYKVHIELCKHYVNFGQFINNPNDFISILRTPSALLASGPRHLLKEYAKCLIQHGLDYTLFGSKLPKHWNGEKYIEATEEIKLLLLGRTYFIGEDFLFTKR